MTATGDGGHSFFPTLPKHTARKPQSAAIRSTGRQLQRCYMRLLFIVLALLPGLAETLTGVASVVDGDTLEIHGERIRLHGIDAPESAQRCHRPDGAPWRCGQKAAFALADRIDRQTVRCQGKERDRYGRLVAVCYHQGKDLNAWMVRRGWALAYRRYSHDYVGQERKAKARQAGIWAGRFVPPWEWRSRRRSGATNDKDCPDFKTHAAAQRFYQAHQPGDPHRLDGNGDGVACESLP